MSDYVLEASNLSKSYQEGERRLDVVKQVNMALHAGDFSVIVGASGSGKTTLLHLLAGLDLPSDGEVRIRGQAFSVLREAERGRLRNREIGVVYQFHHLLPEFTAVENVAMPLLLGQDSPRQARKQSIKMLEQVGLGERLNHKPAELSGGERQRVAIARALVTRPSLVMADEPTGNLDSQTAAGIYDLMQGLNQNLNTSFLIVTHDERLSRQARRVFRMQDGLLSEDA